jgi:hypothetical protein
VNQLKIILRSHRESLRKVQRRRKKGPFAISFYFEKKKISQRTVAAGRAKYAPEIGPTSLKMAIAHTILIWFWATNKSLNRMVMN